MLQNGQTESRPRLCWLVPSDNGGGAIWVADSCCGQAAEAGYDVTLLTMEPLREATMSGITYAIESMNVVPPYADTPTRFVKLVVERHFDVIFFNDCHAMDACIPYLPPKVRCVYVVHDTMSFYWKQAVRHEASLDAIVAVSETAASRFRHKLKQTRKLQVIQNGTVFPPLRDDLPEREKYALVFLGGDSPLKGAHDVLEVWPRLIRSGFAGRLHWYGRISDEFKWQILRLPDANRIELHGHAPRAEVFDCLERSSVILMLSRAEAFGMVLIEGMGMGCVPVTWNAAGTANNEVVAPRFRFASPLGDYDALAHQILSATESRHSLAQELVTQTREQFSDARMWHSYEALIEGMAGRPAASRPLVGLLAPGYVPPRRASHFVPRAVWKHLRPYIGRRPRLFNFLRNRM